MKHQKDKKSSGTNAAIKRPKKLAVLFFVIVIASAGISMFYFNNKGRQNQPDYSRLVGSWVRPDGGYVIEIKNISSDGKVDCAYFNPNPIKVSRAAASIQDGKMKVFVELRDTGYPGCTYNLIYDSKSDTLAGVYYQAAINESFDIIFIRK